MLHSHIWIITDNLNNLIKATQILVIFLSFGINTEYGTFTVTNVNHLMLAVKEETFHVLLCPRTTESVLSVSGLLILPNISSSVIVCLGSVLLSSCDRETVVRSLSGWWFI